MSQDSESFTRDPLEHAALPNMNIVLNEAIDDFTISVDPDDPDPQRRYKLLASRGTWREGLTPATSADGIRWSWGRDHAVRHFGDRCAYWYDPIRKRHIAWSRNQPILRKRVIFHAESDDFETWTPPRLAIDTDSLDHPDAQIYGGYGFWYQSPNLAYIEVYDVAHQRLHTELASSWDALTWSRMCDHVVILSNGEHRSFDAYWTVPTFTPPHLRDGELLIHYGGRPDPHKASGFDHVPPGMGGALGLSRLREDGFVSLDATGQQGIVKTHPLAVGPGRSKLLINVSPFHPDRIPIEVIVEARSEQDTLSAYQLDATDPSRVWYKVDLGQEIPKITTVRFRLRNAPLYSFRIA